jgi:transposase
LIRDLSCGDKRVFLSLKIRRVDCWRCGAIKTERLDWLSQLPGFTQRFAYFVGRRCHDAPVKVVAKELRLDWHTVKELDKLYMSEQLRRAPEPHPTVLGIDEISMGKGHQYRIVVSDLLEGRPIWFGGVDRSEASLDEFYTWLGPVKSKEIRLAVMDMWKAFRSSTRKAQNAPQAAILYDKFHVLRHLQDALDKVRRCEYARLSGPGRRLPNARVLSGDFCDQPH